MGSAIATLIAYASMMLVSYVMGQKQYPIPYDKKAIGGYLGISILLSFVYFYCFRENYFIGIAFILVFLGIIYKFENAMIKKIIKR